MNRTKNATATGDAVANRATTRDARAIRRAVQKGLEGPALDFARAIDFDKLAAAWKGARAWGDNACINYELDAETGLNLFWVSTDRNTYELGPFGRLADAEQAAKAHGLALEPADGDTLAADGENARAGGAPW